MENNLFNDIVKEAINGAYWLRGLERLDEISIKKILSHGEDGGFMIISANRTQISNDENIDADILNSDSLLVEFLNDVFNSTDYSHDKIKEIIDTDEAKAWLKKRNKTEDSNLKKDIISAGYSFTPVFGGYHEKGWVADALEPSYVVYNKFRDGEKGSLYDFANFAIDLCKKYKQDSVYIKRPGDAPVYVNGEGKVVSKRSSNNVILNDKEQMFYTTNKRNKNADRFTSDIEFPKDNEEFTPKDYDMNPLNENILYCKNIEYIDRMRRHQNGEIFL